jgi:molecular chaperone DnaK (HSP70)
VLSYVDTTELSDAAPRVKVFPIAQTVSPGVVETRDHLPSFMYLAAGPEFPARALDLPWSDSRRYTVGELARAQGAAVPARLVSSAKSWLCHPGVDRTSAILPWQSPEEVPKISPLDASTRYLEHLRDAWNQERTEGNPELRLEEQEVFLTVPASFDAVSRDLTLRAAQQAGFNQLTLLEEPQAAFYAWLGHQGEQWREQLSVGDVILVCDIGGGTSDFSLISVKEQE